MTNLQLFMAIVTVMIILMSGLYKFIKDIITIKLDGFKLYFDEKFRGIDKLLQDHENRIRSMEKK
jgi:hypothetical protein